MTISELRTKQLLFTFWIDDVDRQMAGTSYSYYWDDDSRKIYVMGQHDDACSSHGSFVFGPDEVTSKIALAKAKEFCPEKYKQIEEFLQCKKKV